MSDPQLNMTVLDKLLRTFKKNPPELKIGIFGGVHASKNKKSNQTLTNAELGAIHEFGAPNRGIPQRSFLRIPIAEHLGPKMESSGVFKEDVMKKTLAQGDLIPWVEKVAVIAEDIVAEAFNSGGYGKWPKWKDPNYENNTGQLLLDTQQLRNSITTQIKGGT